VRGTTLTVDPFRGSTAPLAGLSRKERERFRGGTTRPATSPGLGANIFPVQPVKCTSFREARSTVTKSSGVFAASPSLAGWYSMRNCDAVTTTRRYP